MDVVFRKPKLLRALTTLDPGEFARLEAGLAEALAEQRAQCRHDGGARQRAAGAGGATSKLPTARAKLFFLLFYFKSYPTREAMGFFFGLSQPQVCEWVKALTPLVSAALGRELLRPARRPADLGALLAETPELLLIIDGAERPVCRPKDPEAQSKDYSGKKKSHRKKNLVVSSRRKVVYLGPTAPGSVHDKRLADESGLVFPPGTLLFKDTAFQGYEPPGIDTLQPKRKPPKKELHPIQKTINQIISRTRVGVEHVIGGIKRCHIVADIFRARRRDFVDEVMSVAGGLHNLRVATRQPLAV